MVAAKRQLMVAVALLTPQRDRLPFQSVSLLDSYFSPALAHQPAIILRLGPQVADWLQLFGTFPAVRLRGCYLVRLTAGN